MGALLYLAAWDAIKTAVPTIEIVVLMGLILVLARGGLVTRRTYQRMTHRADAWRYIAEELRETVTGSVRGPRRITAAPVGGTLVTLTATIRCPFCDAVYPSPNGQEIVENTDDSFHSMPRTLVCRACCKRFVKPIPSGWARHASGLSLASPAKPQRQAEGYGETRPGMTQSPVAAHSAPKTPRTALGPSPRFRTLYGDRGRD